jgi:NADH-quinone oxidoreductase subunit A
MNVYSAHTVILWPAVVYFVASLLIVTGMIILSYVLGQRHKERATGEPYESGIVSTGTARMRFDVRFYMVGMFFVIFDLESVFIISWAVALRESGWPGFYEMIVFIGLLVAVLLYLWRIGALDWGPIRQRAIPMRGKE